MDDPILLQSENRLLSKSGSNDFSLYGAQPAPATPADGAAAAEPSDAPESAGPQRSSDAGAPDAGQPQQISTAGADDADRSEAAAASSQAVPLQGAQTPAGDPAASITPLAPLTAQGSILSETVTSPQQSAAPSEQLVSIAAPSAAGPIDAVDGILPPVGSSAQGLLDGIQPVQGLVQTLAEAAPGASPDPAAILGQVDAPIGVDDGLDGLLGSDPAGGIATLISMVSVSDLLDVREGGSEPAAAVADPAMHFIDTLAVDESGAGAHEDVDSDGDDAADGLLTLPTSDDPDLDDLL